MFSASTHSKPLPLRELVEKLEALIKNQRHAQQLLLTDHDYVGKRIKQMISSKRSKVAARPIIPTAIFTNYCCSTELHVRFSRILSPTPSCLVRFAAIQGFSSGISSLLIRYPTSSRLPDRSIYCR
ncbi:hypothetical protein L3Y34_017211 [Caenorhabditis briggsae]|uniref:Uncharacterized protein n=1 Tax=Caenorhabditis briggsae TaxID=6238 RepID=A0AAE9DH48_CAEBR|nr:hypothetical protein L3Y34_017211 [Caenorhabditis briggsae]